MRFTYRVEYNKVYSIRGSDRSLALINVTRGDYHAMKATSRDRKSLQSISDTDLFLEHNETRFVKNAYSLLYGRYFILKVLS